MPILIQEKSYSRMKKKTTHNITRLLVIACENSWILLLIHTWLCCMEKKQNPKQCEHKLSKWWYLRKCIFNVLFLCNTQNAPFSTLSLLAILTNNISELGCLLWYVFQKIWELSSYFCARIFRQIRIKPCRINLYNILWFLSCNRHS